MIELKSSSVNHIDCVKDVLEQEAQGILSLKDLIGDSINDALNLILQCKGRVVITGIGKSGIIGRKINATMASTGTTSLFLHPSEGLHGDLGMVTKDDIVIAISNSGESEEVLRLLPSVKRIGTKIISIVKNPSSTLAVNSDVILSIGNVNEACPLGLAPTTSTTVTLALGDAMAVALLKARNFQREDFALFHPAGSLGRRLLLKVEDVIQSTCKNPIIEENATIKESLFLMTAQGLGATSIVDENGQLAGILTDGDIRRAFAMVDDVLYKPVKELCNKTPIVIQRDMLAADALRLMEDKKINVLPVVNDSYEPVGMIHIHNLMDLGL